ncbi:DUF58 domain-containing protein [Sphingomonas sp. SUN039]|uniref:DUF58 domain-containing protein n=1 Tax=Sphingomonas sp. SUN039 TaxID=2937787 RepID=UPI0021645B94|nr:DUF58 domain-containing protein [Sphingomonas sp. SUN039]UVO55686.1 DUF58 domain-containing protein [Sphingomonas sp. SUN039]
MIYPSGRAAVLAAASAVPAIAVAVLVPAYWYAGLAVVLLVLALTLADALGTPGARSLTATLDAPAAVFVGQDVALGIAARVGSGRRFEVAIEHDARLAPTDSARGPVDASGKMTFTAVRRGAAVVDALWLRWPGLFGLVWRQKRVELDRSIAVLPDVRPARTEALRLFRRDASFGELVQIDTGAGGEFQALAEFRQGMDRRAIDWKASARHSGLIAKEYRTERNNDIVFAVDAGRLMCEPVDGIPRIDRAISAALTAAFVALKLGDKVSLFGFDARPRISTGSVSGVASFATFQGLAAELDYSNEETNFTLALTTLGSQLKRRSLVLVFTDFADPTSAELMLKTVGRLAERHLVLFVLMEDVELQAMADTAPEHSADVSRAVIAASMLRERKIVVARLQRLGVHIVEAHHDRIGSELVNAYLGLKRRNLL